MRKIGLLLALAGISTAALAVKLPGVKLGGKDDKAPGGEVRKVANPIPGRYIVVLEDSAGAPASVAGRLLGPLGLKPDLVFEKVLKALVVQATPAQAARLAGDARVRYVEQDGKVKLSEAQKNATWGLDRIDQAALPLDRSFTPAGSGEGGHAYVIDTGIRNGHADFSGRIGKGYNVAAASDGLLDLLSPLAGGLLGGGNSGDPDDTEDCNGHGTHVAGTVAGSEYGVAKKATIHAVRVLDCQGSGATSGVIEGVDWVTKNAEGAAVVNMSLGGGASDALDEAVRNSIKAGLFYAVAAGNDNADACGSSPAREPAAMTVGATDNSDQRSSFSNHGSCVDIFAPGTDISSAWHTGDSASKTISGTSMASPHVAGVAVLLRVADPEASPQQIAERLLAAAVTGKVGNPAKGSPNLLLQQGAIPPVSEAPGAPGAAPPAEGDSPEQDAPDQAGPPPSAEPGQSTASFSARCAELSCRFYPQRGGDEARYRWTYGDGFDGETPVGSHVYAEPGDYPVTLAIAGDGAARGGGFTLSLGNESSAPCSGCEAVQGVVAAGEGLSLPSPDGFTLQAARDIQAWLRTGRSNSPLALFLDRLERDRWTAVARAYGYKRDLVLAMDDMDAGTYRFRVAAADGADRFKFWSRVD